MAWGAALLVVFSGFFLPYWTLPETFAPFALCGSLVLMLGAAADGAESLPGFSGTTFQRKILRWVAVGLLAGCGHLTRADGVLLLLVVLGWLMHVASLKCGEQMPLRSLLVRGGLVLLGYMFAMGPWFLRNWTLIGRPLGAGGTKTLWLTHYDELFGYGADISLQSYLAWGWGNILRSKLWALGVNLQRFLAENCLVFLFPFTLVGFYRWRRQPRFMLTGLYTLTIFAVHSLVFTFAGPRGSFFHASAATLPFTAVAGVEGIYAVGGWAARRRRWPLRQAQRVFGGATVVAAVLLSGYATVSKVIEWQSVGSAYIALGDWLDERGDQDAIVMIANPPALWYHTRHSAVAVPNGDVDTLLHVIRRYEVSYVALDRSCPADLMSICTGSASDPALGDPVLEVDMLRVFAVEHHWRASRDR